MKRILFALFIVLASSSVTDADESNEAAIEEMISAAQAVKQKGQGIWNISSFSNQNEDEPSTSILIYFKKGLRNLKLGCKVIPEKKECMRTISIILKNWTTLKATSSTELQIKKRNFTEFMDDLMTFLQEYRKS